MTTQTMRIYFDAMVKAGKFKGELHKVRGRKEDLPLPLLTLHADPRRKHTNAMAAC